MEIDWQSSWGWGLLLIVVTMAIHAVGVVTITFWLDHVRLHVIRHRYPRASNIVIATAVVGIIGLLLALLHGFESGLWAFAFVRLGALGSHHEAILYSLDSMTTRGASGLQLSDHWLFMGALEAADGMLLFGISTAFVFSVLQRIMPLIGVDRPDDEAGDESPGSHTNVRKA
jgi:hypothetical protein